MKRSKNRAAVHLGRLGGSARTSKPKGFAAMSPKRRRKLGQSGGIATRNKRNNTKER